MALSAHIRMDHQFSATRRPSLMDRVKSVGQFLTSDAAKKIAFIGSSAAVGAAAKFGSVALLSGVGITATAGVGSALAVAMVGGAAVGVAKTGLSALFNKKAADKPTAGTLLKNVLLGSAISGATFGLLSGGDSLLHNTEFGQKFVEKAVSFYDDYVSGILSIVKPVHITHQATPILPITDSVPSSIPSAQSLAPNEAILPDSPTHVKVAPVANSVVTQVSYPTPDAPAVDVAADKPVTTINKATVRVHQSFEPAADAPVKAPVVAAPAAAPVIDVAAQELAKAQAALNDDYVTERLRNFILKTTGVPAPADATPLEMAKSMSEKYPETILKALAQQAPKLDADQMAAFCKTDIPTSFGAENTIHTDCEVMKPEMADNDFVTVRDVNQPEPKKGLRAVFAKGVASTREFIDRAVVRGAVTEMTEDSQREFFQANATPAIQ